MSVSQINNRYYDGYTLQPEYLPPFLDKAFAELACKEANLFLHERKIVKKCEGFYLRMNEEAKELMLVIPEVPQRIIYKGIHKTYIASTTLYAPLTLPKKIEYSPSVLVQTNSALLEDSNAIHKKLYQAFLKEKPPGVYIIEPYDSLEKGVYTQNWSQTLLDYRSKPDQMGCFLHDMTRTISWIHKQGYVHSKICFKNFLVWDAIDENGNFKKVAFLTNFDHIDEPGAPEARKPEDYCFWDPCMSYADIITPYADYYGLAIAYLMVHFPQMPITQITAVRKAVFNDILSGHNKDNSTYFDKELRGIEKKVWDLFIDICKESTRVYRHFRPSDKALSSGLVMRGINRVKTIDVEARCLELADRLIEPDK